jgi:lipopolysaccharide transport system ATP-binding protein
MVVRLKGKVNREEYWALQGVDLTIPKGRTLGIIGNNGAGKSTLLRLLCGLGRPTHGKVMRRGRLSSLLELGTGFHSDFSGRENVVTYCLLSGLTRKETLDLMPQIIEFSELEDFIDNPVRTYSSGMYVRLGFAAAICTDPDIVVVDEVLAVGDLRFKKKCLDRLAELKKAGKTILLVSHAMDQIETLCDEVVWLENGRVREHGETNEVVNHYKNRVFSVSGTNKKAVIDENQADLTGTQATAPRQEHRTGQTPIAVRNVWLTNEGNQEIDAIAPGDSITVHVEYEAQQRVELPIFVVTLYRDDGVKCYETSTQADGIFISEALGKASLSLIFSEMPLMEGYYFFDVSLYDQNWDQIFEYRNRAAPFHVLGYRPGSGVFHPPHRWEET